MVSQGHRYTISKLCCIYRYLVLVARGWSISARTICSTSHPSLTYPKGESTIQGLSLSFVFTATQLFWFLLSMTLFFPTLDCSHRVCQSSVVRPHFFSYSIEKGASLQHMFYDWSSWPQCTCWGGHQLQLLVHKNKVYKIYILSFHLSTQNSVMNAILPVTYTRVYF